jgi:hypothetical protein
VRIPCAFASDSSHSVAECCLGAWQDSIQNVQTEHKGLHSTREILTSIELMTGAFFPGLHASLPKSFSRLEEERVV